MNTQSLNRSIGLAMSALQQARHNGQPDMAFHIADAIRHLNKARAYLKDDMQSMARLMAGAASDDIQRAIALR